MRRPDAGGSGTTVRRLLVTASGGPFRGRTPEPSWPSVTVDDALAHPTWQMGPKITVDSSTLMNKGLEVIEAHELFGVGYDRIDVVVHPQSVVHSMVELVDGTTMAQLSRPDMRLPIGYAMGWPERLHTAYGAIDWSAAMSLTFEPPDRTLFACLDLAYAGRPQGGAAPAWLNAANEVAVGRLPGRPAALAGHRRGGGRHHGPWRDEPSDSVDGGAGGRPARPASGRPAAVERRREAA